MSVSSISHYGASPYVSTFKADEAQGSPTQNETSGRTADSGRARGERSAAGRDERVQTYDSTGRLPRNPEDPDQVEDTEESAETDPNSSQKASESEDSEYTPEEQKQIDKLEDRDTEVKAHEQAHIAAGGRYVRGGAHFEYQTGPDGQKYAVGGEVSIDVSKESDPQATIAKMQAVARAAMAPASPSSQDRSVAARASQLEMEARAEAMAEVKGETGQEGDESPQPGKAQSPDGYTTTMDSSSKTSQIDLFI